MVFQLRKDCSNDLMIKNLIWIINLYSLNVYLELNPGNLIWIFQNSIENCKSIDISILKANMCCNRSKVISNKECNVPILSTKYVVNSPLTWLYSIKTIVYCFTIICRGHSKLISTIWKKLSCHNVKYLKRYSDYKIWCQNICKSIFVYFITHYPLKDQL